LHDDIRNVCQDAAYQRRRAAGITRDREGFFQVRHGFGKTSRSTDNHCDAIKSPQNAWQVTGIAACHQAFQVSLSRNIKLAAVKREFCAPRECHRMNFRAGGILCALQ
jgi:hypothetical protein